MFQKLYSDRFDLAICYNDIDPTKLPKGVQALNKAEQPNNLKFLPQGKLPAWKLVPPRLDLNRHEIIMDNDVLLFKPLEEIEEFLAGNKFLTTEAYRRSYSIDYDALIRQDFNINVGIIGMPPGFDMEAAINEKLQRGWSEFFDDQSIVAAILQDQDTIVVSKQKIVVAFGDTFYAKGTHGVHLVGLNSGETRHWKKLFTF